VRDRFDEPPPEPALRRASLPVVHAA
jgi:hypothetical protein